MMTRYEASSAEADDARVTLEVRPFDGLPAMVRIQSDGSEYVATLTVDDVDDIFGVGRSANEAVEDLVATLHETRRHLETNSVPLSSRLQRQLESLKSLLPDKAEVFKADTGVRRKSYPRQESSNLGRNPAFRWAAAS